MEINLYDTEKMLNKYHSLMKRIYIWFDKTIMGLYMYENFPNFIIKNVKRI